MTTLELLLTNSLNQGHKKNTSINNSFGANRSDYSQNLYVSSKHRLRLLGPKTFMVQLLNLIRVYVYAYIIPKWSKAIENLMKSQMIKTSPEKSPLLH